MLTLKQEDRLIKKITSLTELELSSIIKRIAEHLQKNNLEHLIDESFDIETYEDELEDAQDRIEVLESTLSDILSIAEMIDLDDMDEDVVEDKISEIQNLASV